MENENNNLGHKPSEPSYDERAYYKERWTNEISEDIPSDVVDKLLQTHPQVGADPQYTQYRTTSVDGDLDAIKEARRMKVRKEIEAEHKPNADVSYKKEREINASADEKPGKKQLDEKREHRDKKEPKKETLVKKKEPQAKPKNPTPKPVRYANKPFRRTPKSLANDEDLIRTAGYPQDNEPIFAEEKAEKPRNRINPAFNMDLENMSKQMDIDALYNSENVDYEEESFFEGSATAKIAAITATVAVVILLFAVAVMAGKLSKANDRIEELTEMQVQNEQLKMEILTLNDEISNLKNGETPKDGEKTAETAEGDDAFETYKVVSGDTIGGISSRFYGDAGKYQKIMDANGITNPNQLREGQELKIPKK